VPSSQKKIKKYHLSRRVYVDESFLYDNEQPARGRSRKGRKINKKGKRRGRRFPFVVATRLDQLVHPPLLVKKDFDDKNWKEYALEVLLPRLRRNDVVIWDRLGRSGRKKKPVKQHFNPEVIHKIKINSKRKVVFLPPLGKLFNPVELVHGKLKAIVRKAYRSSKAAKEGRVRNYYELWRDLVEASRQITTSDLHGFFRERAQGRAFKKECPYLFHK
jgi:transposase